MTDGLEHHGVCGFCGSGVRAGTDLCPRCGAVWRSRLTQGQRLSLAVVLVVFLGMLSRRAAYHVADLLVLHPYGRLGQILELAVFLSLWALVSALVIWLISRIGGKRYWYKYMRRS